MRWLLGLAVLLALAAQTAWAQVQNWAVWTQMTGASPYYTASGTLQTPTGSVTCTFTITPTDGSATNGGYIIERALSSGLSGSIWKNATVYGPAPWGDRWVRALSVVCDVTRLPPLLL